MKNLTPLKILVALIPFLTGVFYEWESALVSVALIILIVIYVFRNKKLTILPGLPLYFALGVVVFHAVSAFWAVDPGMMPLGVLKFLPLPLFVIAASQISDVSHKELLDLVPMSGVIMTVLSAALSFVGPLKGHVIVSGRLGGFFEYPNAFAMFLLVCLILVLFKENIKHADWIFAAVYLTGIALSGSRTVLVLTAATAVTFIIWVKDKKIKLISVAVCVIGAAVAGIYLFNKLPSLTNGSTFYGRLLYFGDALPVILKHPLGLGYYGYYYTQGEFQTGVYSVVHIHNDLLQILLDTGWIPAVLGVLMYVKAFMKAGFRNRLLLIMLGLHILFDFDMQFIAMAVILLAVVISGSDVKTKTADSRAVLPAVAAAGAGIVFFAVFFGLASFLCFTRDYSSALKVYPFYTEAEVAVLSSQKDPVEMGRIADHILSRNPNSSIANSAKARVCYSAGNVPQMIEYKEKAIAYSKYSLVEYLDYIDMMKVVISLYIQNEDYDSASFCIKKVIKAADSLERVEAGTSYFGLRIDDKPDLLLPEDYAEYVNSLRQIMV